MKVQISKFKKSQLSEHELYPVLGGSGVTQSHDVTTRCSGSDHDENTKDYYTSPHP